MALTARAPLRKARLSCLWGRPLPIRERMEVAADAEDAFTALPDEAALAAAEEAAADVAAIARGLRHELSSARLCLEEWQADPDRPRRLPGQPAVIAVCDGKAYG